MFYTLNVMTLNYCENLLKNVHERLSLPDPNGETFLVKGDYEYWHYGCDGFNDKVLYLCLSYTFNKYNSI